MSAKDVLSFFEKVSESKALQAKLTKLAKGRQAQAAEDMVELAATAGFKFTTSELAKARKAKAAKTPKSAMPEVAGQYYCPYGIGTDYGCYW